VVVWALDGGGLTILASFYAYQPVFCDIGTITPDPSFCDGVYVAAGDVTGDGLAEVITGTNREAGPVRVFQIGDGVIELTSFHPYFERFKGSVRVAAAMSDHGSPGFSLDGRRRTLLFALNLAHGHAVDTAWPSRRSVLEDGVIRARERSPPAR
jgi:FG-GAP repeat